MSWVFDPIHTSNPISSCKIFFVVPAIGRSYTATDGMGPRTGPALASDTGGDNGRALKSVSVTDVKGFEAGD